MLCSWCDDPATYFLASDRARTGVDRACPVHMIRWRRSYQQVVRLPADIVRGADSVWASLDAAWLTSDSWSIDDKSIDALDGYASLPC